jgi:3-methyladenine DNA glycosylase AlkD
MVFMAEDILECLRRELLNNIDEKTKMSAQNFFKESVLFYGIKTSIVTTIAKVYFKKIKSLNKSQIFGLCENLYKSGYSEEAFIACDWVYALRATYEESDFFTFERWLNLYIDNWAKCDTFCNHSVAAFIEKYPAFIERLFLWTQSDNRWVRRASAVTLILPARKGFHLNEVFHISDNLMDDKDDLVQKGFGWLLKEASRKHLDEVFNYITLNKKIMPRTSLRYAIEKMPEELKKLAMVKDK